MSSVEVRPLRVAIFLESPLSAGGGFQQALSTIDALLDGGGTGHDIVVVTTVAENMPILARHGIAARLLPRGNFSRITDSLSAALPWLDNIYRPLRRWGLSRLGRNLDAFLDEIGADLVMFNEASATALRLSEHPFIITVWDLCHRDLPEFPEVSHGREFERRETIFRTLLPKAVAVIANAPAGVERIADLYHVDRQRIVEIPFLPSLAVRKYANEEVAVTVAKVRARYGLNADYVFYPAQFWPHKNHTYLLQGLAAVERRYGIKLDAAFSGGDKGNRAHVEACARRLGLRERIHFLGFVANEEIPALYAGAKALVMPTYFGPTNLPPLEAAAVGCPVIYSNLPEFRQQIGEAALYCDLDDPNSLAEQLNRLMNEPETVEQLRIAARHLIGKSDPSIYRTRMREVFDRFAHIRGCWATDP